MVNRGCITTKFGNNIHWFDINDKTFLNKTVILNGTRGTGKTTAILHILYKMIKEVPIIFCYTRTEHNFSDYLPEKSIIKNLKQDDLRKKYLWQAARADRYNKANLIENLLDLYMVIAEHHVIDKIKKIKIREQECLRDISSSDLDDDDKETKTKQTIDLTEDTLRTLLKNEIRKNKQKLKNKLLTEIQRFTLMYAFMNPQIIILIDDCAADLSEAQKKRPGKVNTPEAEDSSNSIIKEIFYNGRHKYITFIISTQADKEIDAALRINADITYFTDEPSLELSLSRKANGFTNAIKSIGHDILQSIYSSDIDNKLTKIIYLKNECHEKKFRYIVSPMHPPFKFGSPHMRAILDAISGNK